MAKNCKKLSFGDPTLAIMVDYKNIKVGDLGRLIYTMRLRRETRRKNPNLVLTQFLLLFSVAHISVRIVF